MRLIISVCLFSFFCAVMVVMSFGIATAGQPVTFFPVVSFEQNLLNRTAGHAGLPSVQLNGLRLYLQTDVGGVSGTHFEAPSEDCVRGFNI
jgi:hypothetical protein